MLPAAPRAAAARRRRQQLPARSTAEPSWHRRARRARQRARAVVAVAQARDLLARHHGGGGSAAATHGLMGRGRWNRDDEGWQSRGSRSASRGGGRWGEASGRGGSRRDDRDDKASEIRKENERLRKEVEDQRRRLGQQPVPHPNAKEGPDRDGDWLCSACGFGTNRASRPACYRCAAPKGFSFVAGSKHAPGAANTAAVNGASYAAVVQAAAAPNDFSRLAAPTQFAAMPPPAAQGWSPQLAAPAVPFRVPGFAGNPPATTLPATTTTPTVQTTTNGTVLGSAGVKPLKGRLDALLEARSAVAANALCAEAVAAIDLQIAKAREELAHAQPLEVALRGTLGAVATARQALQRAEAKATKCEQQVTAAVAAYDAAAAEVQACRKQLTDAETTTARTAGNHVDLRQFFGDNPGAAWSAFRAAAEARCAPGAAGVDDKLRMRAAACFAEMHAICSLLPGQPPSPEHAPSATLSSASPTSTSATPASSSTTSPTTPPAATERRDAPGVAPIPNTISGQSSNADAAAIDLAAAALQVAPNSTAHVDPGAAAAAAINRQLQAQAQPPAGMQGGGGAVQALSSALLQPSSAAVPSQFEAVAAAAQEAAAVPVLPPAVDTSECVPPLAEAERQALQAKMDEAEREAQAQLAIQQAAEARALAQRGQSPAAGIASPAGLNEADRDMGDGGAGDVDARGACSPQPATQPATQPAADDSMGGGAADGVAGKRGCAVLDKARAITAKAKAKH